MVNTALLTGLLVRLQRALASQSVRTSRHCADIIIMMSIMIIKRICIALILVGAQRALQYTSNTHVRTHART